ncbi:hypothetical protein GJ496_004342 [Pomphorhynchus laevis]|nr:hypothetical protein GJ496_004342 [Pomphorhynchus laevis]
MRNRIHAVYNNKFCKLVRKYHAFQPRGDSPQDCLVVNEEPHSSSFLTLSDKRINGTVASLLSKGLSFDIRLRSLSKRHELRFISELEMLCGKVVSHFGDRASSLFLINKLTCIRCKLSQLSGRRNALPNISRAEMMSLKENKADPNLVISRADKGCCTVLINYSSYRSKMLNILNDADTFEIAHKDLTKAIYREVIQILKEISNV